MEKKNRCVAEDSVGGGSRARISMSKRRGRLAVCLLSFALASALPGANAMAIAIGAPASELTRASAAGLTTGQLARLLLPPAFADRMVSHKLGKSIFPSGPIHDVSFYTRPVPLGQDLCRRESYYVNVEPVGGLTRENSTRDVPVEVKKIAAPKVQLAAAPGCLLKDGFFASVWPEQSLPGATEALRRLISLQRAARGSGRLRAETSCASETPEDACISGARAVLAKLPLHRVFTIAPAGHGWEFSVMPDDAGQRYWDIKLHDNKGSRQRLELVWRVPPPF